MKHFLIILIFYFTISNLTAQAWEEQSFFQESNPGDYNAFGRTIDIQDDVMIVSSFRNSTDVNENNYIEHAGAVLIYYKDTNEDWVEHQKLVSPNRGYRYHFGDRVVISEDKMIIAVYEPRADYSSVSDPGLVHVYKKDTSGDYIYHLLLQSPRIEPFSKFGMGLFIFNNQLFIGQPHEDDTNGDDLLNAGSVYVYNIETDYSINLSQRLIASDRSAIQNFGEVIAVNSNLLLIGSPQNDTDLQGNTTFINSGAAYIFKKDNNNNWVQHQKILPNQNYEFNYFSQAIALYDNTLVIGAWAHSYDETESNYILRSGAVYIFNVDTNGYFYQTQKIVPPTRYDDMGFGIVVMLNSKHLIISPINNDNAFTDTSYSYKKNTTTNLYELEDLIQIESSYAGDSRLLFGQGMEFINLDEIFINCSICSTNNGHVQGQVYKFKFNENLGIEKYSKPLSVMVFPNPTQGLLHVKFETLQKNVEVKVLNVLGQIVFKTSEINTKSLNLNLKSSSGIYFIEIETNSGTYKEKILIE